MFACSLPSSVLCLLSLSSLDCTQSAFFFFSPSVKIMALDDMTSGIDLKDEN